MHGKTLYRTVSGALIIFLLLVLSAVPVMAEPTDKNVPAEWVDRNNFPEAYSILTSDHIMFPGNVSDWPMKIDSKRQLFVDDYVISSMENVVRKFHQPAKHPSNPLKGGGSVGVLYDEQSGKFRMWGGVYYFESNNGVDWTKPDIGPNGNRFPNVDGDLRGFMYNPDIPESENRYKAVFERRVNKENNEKGGFYLYHSSDGINWQPDSVYPFFTRTINGMNPGPFWTKGPGDTSSFRYDTVLKRYICDGKIGLYYPKSKAKELGLISDGKPRIKLRTMSESEDLVHWTSPRFLLYPDKYDPPDRQIYAHVGFVYESMWVGIIQAMQIMTTGWKQVDLRLSYSRDGRHWLRPRQRGPFIPLGGPDSWDPDYSGTSFTGPVLVGDKLYFYYFGSRNSKRDKTGKRFWPCYVGLAILRQDGFASLNADNTPGQVVTRPLTFEGKTLYINADVGKDGWVKAAVLTRDSNSIESYTLDDSIALAENTTKGRMVWKSKKDLVPPGDEHLRLVFQLKNAKLYSFWIE